MTTAQAKRKQATTYNIFERMAQVRRSLPQLAPKLFHIRTKDKGIVPFDPSIAQTSFLLDPTTGADIVLKARQLGWSTMSVMEFVAYLLFVDGFNGIIVSEDEEKAKMLLQMAWLAIDMMPEKYKVPFKYGRDKYIITESPAKGGRGSSLYIGSAGKFTLGRGQTIHAAHLSELAFWPSEAGEDADTLLQGLEEAVPDKPGAILRIESTANGRGNVFHNKWEAAKRGVGRYKGRFYPWWFSLDDEYKKPVREDFGELTDDEQELIERTWTKYQFRLTKEHIQWRRDKIDAKGKKFWQEYPEDDDTCFLATGASVYISEMEVLDQIRKRLEGREPIFVREIAGIEVEYYRMPKAGVGYTVTVDMAEGEKEKSDFNAVLVNACYDDGRTEEVAWAQGRTSAPTWAELVMTLATEFHGALVGVERANKGFSVLDILEQNIDNPRYDFEIYYHMEFDQTAGKEAKIAGFRPTQSARSVAFNRWGQDVIANDYIISVPLVVSQAMSLQHNPRTGKMEAPRGSFDDLLNCAVIANYIKGEVSTGGTFDVREWD